MSMNMYQLIGSAKLGNLSALPMIPSDYIKMMLAYIIQISRAFSHTHFNGLIHGNFNLSKVIAQSFSSQSPLQKKTSNSQMNQEKLNHIFATQNIYNYFLVNFEPWQVQLLMQKQQDENNIFKDILNHTSQFQLEVNDYKQILKI